jgi:hypothetical protein
VLGDLQVLAAKPVLARGALQITGQQFARLSRRHRPAEIETLRESAVGCDQEIPLPGGFHTFRHHLDA